MRITLPCRFRTSHLRLRPEISHSTRPPLIRIDDATFYRRQPAQSSRENNELPNKPLYPNLTYDFPADNVRKEYWSLIGPANAGKTTFLELLQGQHLCFPPTARSYPYLSTQELLAKDRRLSWPPRAIQYVGFNDKQKGLSGMGTYLSARYESRKEITDFSLRDYLLGRTQLNVEEDLQERPDEVLLIEVVEKLRLGDLLDMPTANLSNGQTRRARIAKALLGKPELLLLDEPFIGLDPPTLTQLNPILRNLAYNSSPRLLLALRPQDPVPEWITHLMYLGSPLTISHQGEKQNVIKALSIEVRANVRETHARRRNGDDSVKLDGVPRFNNEIGRTLLDDGIVENPVHLTAKVGQQVQRGLDEYSKGSRSESTFSKLGLNGSSQRRDGNHFWRMIPKPPPVGEPLVEMNGVDVRYGENSVLGHWHEQFHLQVAMKGSSVTTKIDANLQRTKMAVDDTPQPGLHWTVRRGERWAVIGPNGSGKTTLLSLITSDHPQAYALPMRLFGRSRLPELGQPGLSLFELQSRIGHSSPEVHSFFPRGISVRRTLESAFAETPLSRPRLSTTSDARVNACLRWFRAELNPDAGPDPRLQEEALRFGRDPKKPYVDATNAAVFKKRRSAYVFEMQDEYQRGLAWADSMTFGSLTFSAQRLALFLRAIVAQPDIVILDEAFSGMDDMMRDKCLLFLSHGETAVHSPFLINHGFLAKDKLSVRRRRPGVIGKKQIVISEGLTAKQALIVISHVAAEIPASINQFLYLPDRTSNPDSGGPRCVTGHARDIQMAKDPHLWQAIWNIPNLPIREPQSRVAMSSDSEAADLITASKQDVSRIQNRISRWRTAFSRIKSSLDGQLRDSIYWRRVVAEIRERTRRQKIEKRIQRRRNLDRRHVKSLHFRIAHADKLIASYTGRIERIIERLEAVPGKIEQVRQDQRVYEEQGYEITGDFARRWLLAQKRDKPMLERQKKLREAHVITKEELVGRLKVVEARMEEMEKGTEMESSIMGPGPVP